MDAPLTEKQSGILSFIREFTDENGFPPTIRDIGTRFGINSSNGIVCHLASLRAKKLLDWTPHKSRSIRLTEKRKCPHCGKEI